MSADPVCLFWTHDRKRPPSSCDVSTQTAAAARALNRSTRKLIMKMGISRGASEWDEKATRPCLSAMHFETQWMKKSSEKYNRKWFKIQSVHLHTHDALCVSSGSFHYAFLLFFSTNSSMSRYTCRTRNSFLYPNNIVIFCQSNPESLLGCWPSMFPPEAFTLRCLQTTCDDRWLCCPMLSILIEWQQRQLHVIL